MEAPISVLPGIGPQRAKLLEKLNLFTVDDLLHFLPRGYRDYNQTTLIAQVEMGEEVVIRAQLASQPREVRLRGGMTLTQVKIEDDSGLIECVWFNQPFMKRALTGEDFLYFVGRAARRQGRLQLLNPTIEKLNPGKDEILPLMPVYPLTQGISQKVMRNLVIAALEYSRGKIVDALPLRLRQHCGLCEAGFAIENIHFPKDKEALRLAGRRLSFEELLYFLAAVAHLKGERLALTDGQACVYDATKFNAAIEALPYDLTGAQRRALDEILADMAQTKPMNRLLQGDVGSGKTAIAALALYAVYLSGRQGAFMAPTEILAAQHEESLKEFLKPLGVRIARLSGGMPAGKRRDLLAFLEKGQIDILVGTHALLQDDVRFQALGLVVTDEQHRFGVGQRARLADKGKGVDVLVMSATPIPRTLSLILYGDLDVSVIDELPPGRRPVQTSMVPERKRADMYRFILKEVADGGQAYIVCPLVEQSETLEVHSAQELYRQLAKGPLKEIALGCVHGKMRPAEKEAAISAFTVGEIKVLVATSVIEVGVNVPNASIMVIENAERFGLAQLHQLRGRVGRGNRQSYCFLMGGDLSQTARERLELLTQTQNGFELAQKDMELRGPGEYLGTQQHGTLDSQLLRLTQNLQEVYEVCEIVEMLSSDANWRAEAELVFKAAMARHVKRLKSIAMN